MKKWIIVVSVIVIFVISVFIIFGLFNVRGQTKCAGPGCGGSGTICGGIDCPDDCLTLRDTTCKAQCDNATERKIDGPFCEKENFVCCQLKLHPLN